MCLKKTPSQRNRAPLCGVSTGYPIQIVAVDIMGPISPGVRVLVHTCGFRLLHQVGGGLRNTNQEAVTVADKLIDKFFCGLGVVGRIGYCSNVKAQ